MAAYPSSRVRPASVMRIRSTMIVTPRGSLMGSVTTVASSACTRPESISTEKPCAISKCSGRPRGVPASFSSARRCSRLTRHAEYVEGLCVEYNAYNPPSELLPQQRSRLWPVLLRRVLAILGRSRNITGRSGPTVRFHTFASPSLFDFAFAAGHRFPTLRLIAARRRTDGAGASW
jgi:hypothetical protein